MKKLLRKNIKGKQAVVILIPLTLFLLIILVYFMLTNFLFNKFEAEEHCSNVGLQKSKHGELWGPEEAKKCIENYKNN